MFPVACYPRANTTLGGDATSGGATDVWEWEVGIAMQWETGIFIQTN